MSKQVISAIVCSLALGGATLGVSAQAADRGFCQGYARAAVVQFRAAAHNDRCRGLLRDDAAWSPDFRHHFDWCLTVDRREANGQRQSRKDALDHCA
jgi:hypothetical protein